MNEGYELAQLIKSAAQKTVAAMQLCDVALVEIVSVNPLQVRYGSVGLLTDEDVYVGSAARARLAAGARALALRATGGQFFYILDVVEGSL